MFPHDPMRERCRCASRSAHHGPRRALRTRLSVLLAALALACLAPGVVLAQATTEPPPGTAADADVTYTDPTNTFSVTVPAGWSSQAEDGILTLTDPDGQVQTHVLAVTSESAEAAIGEAWRTIDPGFDLDAAQTTVPPATGDLDELVQIIYRTPRDTVVAGLGYRYGGEVLVFLARGPLDAYVKRQAQISVIATSIKALAFQEEDLSGAAPRSVTQAVAPDLEQFVPDALAAATVPGAVVAVVQNGEVAYLRAFGVRSLATGEPLRTTDQMMIGSVTKSFTTLMMATMVDDGIMRWDTPVVDILPSFALADPEATRSLTMRNLVCACTGVPRRDLEFMLNADTLGAEGVVRTLAGFELYTKVGETFQYSNQMVAAAGYIAAVAAGASPDAMLPGYAAELQRRVLTPMGLRNTTLSLLQVRAAGTGATPHGLALDNTFEPLPLTAEHLLMPVAPAGALWSTGPDMARYVLTLLAGGVTPEGRRIVSQDGLGTLFEPQTQINANVRYALGWMVSDWKGLRLIQHDGNTFGFTAAVAMLPEQDLGVVVLANARGANVFASAVVSRVLEDAFGLDTSDSNASFRFALDYTRNNVSEYLDRMQDDLDLPALRPFLGRFHNGALGDITVTVDGGRLWLDVGEFRQELRRHLDKDGQSRYVAFDPPLAGLTLAPAGEPGEPAWTLIWQPEDYRFTRR